MGKFYICKCFYTRNIFLKRLNIHVEYSDKESFLQSYQKVLQNKGILKEDDKEQLISEIEEEINRRKRLGQDYLDRRRVIRDSYSRKHAEIFKLQDKFLSPEFKSIVEYCTSPDVDFEGVCDHVIETNIERAYGVPVFTADFCQLFLEEIRNFENSSCPKGRPNTMNKYGVLLDELGFDQFMTELRENFLQPLARHLYPDWGGGKLDSHKAFIVQYKMSEDLDLSYHYDNAEVTLNVPISPSSAFSGGKLYFGPMRTDKSGKGKLTEYEHIPSVGLLHRGQHMHGASAITSGERYNLIIWMRSSAVRNKLCPMCDKTPDLAETVGYGDGFTTKKEVVNVCTVE